MVAHYVVCTCVLLAVLFGVFWRYGVGKPLRILSQAARKVAAGVQIPPVRRDGKKDELEVLIEDFNTMARELAGNEMLKSDFIANVFEWLAKVTHTRPLFTRYALSTIASNERAQQPRRRLGVHGRPGNGRRFWNILLSNRSCEPLRTGFWIFQQICSSNSNQCAPTHKISSRNRVALP